MIFLAILIGIASGFRVLNFIASAWPDLNSSLYNNFGDRWPELLITIEKTAMFALLFLGAIFIIIGRRHWGIHHLVRALLGMIGLFLAAIAFSQAFPNSYPAGFNELLKSGQALPAFEILLNSIGQKAMTAGITFLISVLILAWPPNKQTLMAPSIKQGVSL